jgi:hypothetical protein
VTAAMTLATAAALASLLTSRPTLATRHTDATITYTGGRTLPALVRG